MAFRLSSSGSDDDDESSSGAYVRIARKKVKTAADEENWLSTPHNDENGDDDDARRRRRRPAAQEQRRSRGDSVSSYYGDDEDDYALEMSDTEAAVLTIRNATFRWGSEQQPKVVWRHHLYCEVANRTAVDRELETLASKGRVRLLQLPTSPDDVGVMLAEDWKAEVRRITKRGKLFDDFLALSLRGKHGLYLAQSDLPSSSSQDVSLLLEAGVLRPRRDDGRSAGETYWFACPRFGELARRVRHCRDALLKALRSARFKQLRVDHKTEGGAGGKKKNSVLRTLDDPSSPNYVGGIQFHVRDLVGSGAAVVEHKANGRYLRLVQQQQQHL